MNELIEYMRELNYVTLVIRLVLAMGLGGCIGLEREKYRRPAGFRTHILVCVGACMTSMISVYFSTILNLNGDVARIPAQVVSGLGFLGVGTILVKGRDHIIGLTTAAGLWATGIVGIACGYGFYSGAIVCTVIMMISMMTFFKFESAKKERRSSIEVYVELEDAHMVNNVIRNVEDKFKGRNFLIVSPRSAMKSAVGIEITIPIDENGVDKELLDRIVVEVEGVVYAVESTPKKLS